MQAGAGLREGAREWRGAEAEATAGPIRQPPRAMAIDVQLIELGCVQKA